MFVIYSLLINTITWRENLLSVHKIFACNHIRFSRTVKMASLYNFSCIPKNDVEVQTVFSWQVFFYLLLPANILSLEVKSGQNLRIKFI
jgi:hypothetical protein